MTTALFEIEFFLASIDELDRKADTNLSCNFTVEYSASSETEINLLFLSDMSLILSKGLILKVRLEWKSLITVKYTSTNFLLFYMNVLSTIS